MKVRQLPANLPAPPGTRCVPTVAHRAALGPARAERLAGDPRFARLREAPLVEPPRRAWGSFLLGVLLELPAFLLMLAFVGGVLFLLIGAMG